MGYSKSYLAYPDVKDAFDRALLNPTGVRITFAGRRAASHFVARCNAFRVLDREENVKLYEPGHSLHGRSPYDTLFIHRDHTADEPGCIVVIERIQIIPEAIIDF